MQIAELEERYVAELVTRDAQYAREIAVFRDAVTDIAATPEGAAALARYNQGDWQGAREVLDALAQSRRQREARTRASARAEQLCRGFTATTQFRLDSAGIEGAYACEDGAFGLSGEAVCLLQERHVVVRESCGASE